MLNSALAIERKVAMPKFDNSKKGQFVLKISPQSPQEIEDGDSPVGYLYLPNHPGPGTGCVAKTLRLLNLYEYSGGPDLCLDFDENNRLIGIEFT